MSNMRVSPGTPCIIIGGSGGSPNIGKQVEAVRLVCSGDRIGPWRVSNKQKGRTWMVKGSPEIKTKLASNGVWVHLQLNNETFSIIKEVHLLPITPPAPRLQVTSIKKLKVPSDATEFEVV